MNPKNALITGITGQDGSYLAELLLGKGYKKVYGLVRRLSCPNYERIAHILDNITLIQGDLLDQSSLERALDLAQPDEVYNLAAQSHVGTSFQQPVATGEYNGLGVVRLLEAIRLSGADIRFYQASTSELYGNSRTPKQNEHTPFAPRSPYATAKLYAHASTLAYRESYGLFACAGILFNHESPRRGLDFVTRKIARGVAAIHRGESSTLRLGNLDASRDWGYAPDYVKAMWLMLQQPNADEYVIATGEKHSIREFVDEAFGCAGINNWEKYIQIDEQCMRPADVHSLCGDASKAHTALGWYPSICFGELVWKMVEAELRSTGEIQANGKRKI
jgi:GDPmannose 4,6-dehydratase